MNVKPLRTLQIALGLSGDSVDSQYGPNIHTGVKRTLQRLNPTRWNAEGWVSLGRTRNYDWMHVQAARI